ncbi:MAG: site-2 protease family protein [Eubacteriales bacterium]|nr:site-2 protease family protein [Eubacteriales bacterium]
MGILTRLQSWGTWLTTDPVGFIVYILYFSVAVLLTLMLHEIAHGYVAYRCGDPTAKMMGRLTLDPRKHLDPLGTISLVLLGFGWAKPVPVNPRNFRGNYRRDDFLVSIAGIATNLTLFIVSLLLATLINPLLWKPEVITGNGGATAFLSSSGVGYAILLSGSGGDFTQYMLHPWLMHVQRFLLLFSTMNVTIAVFNLLPIPPLDGFHVLNDLILKGKLTMNHQFFQIAQVVLLLLVFSGALTTVLSTVVGAVNGGVLHLFLLLEGAA